MSDPVRVCRHCQEEITDPETDGVIVAHELGNSGPGWDVWAHREHADLVDLIDDDLLRIMLRIWSAKLEQPGA
ncbi:hypothetical protein PV729_07700 [Streptomyces europaeiscabiei]|uniref:Uncharacterized protein n=1 Tax=Streptomyces europaeiscabiei TaxID=146819 RepID=A0ABU4NA72_9ACTN|nr:hypothetical protein [Streptomyces europaeiscabiei]MDX3541314.1 hypothetical protein [Streptomyces europaeiscabiei]MDX3551655.1 hypothetical protein [Streptomyces europaeiscabiei]MDX3699894.1 hypothetical protein [Streptomyces europaeiscabiei]